MIDGGDVQGVSWERAKGEESTNQVIMESKTVTLEDDRKTVDVLGNIPNNKFQNGSNVGRKFDMAFL